MNESHTLRTSQGSKYVKKLTQQYLKDLNPIVFASSEFSSTCRFNDGLWQTPKYYSNWNWLTGDSELQPYYEQAKWLMYVFISHPLLDDLRFSTLGRYHYALKALARACRDADVAHLALFFSDPRSSKKIFDILVSSNGGASFVLTGAAFFNVYFELGERALGFQTRRGPIYHEIRRLRQEANQNAAQTPVIPWSIYSTLMVSVIDRIEFYRDWLRDPIWGNAIRYHMSRRTSTADRNRRVGKTVGHWLLDANPAFAAQISSYRSLVAELRAMQQLSRIGILIFTGCRIGEEHALLANCLEPRGDGKYFVKGQTTKTQEGVARWITNEFGAESVRLALDVREKVSYGIAREEIDLSSFLAPSLHDFPAQLGKPRPKSFPKYEHLEKPSTPLNGVLTRCAINVSKISKLDFQFLEQLETASNIDLSKFHVGQRFPLSPHQFRRSFIYFIARTRQVDFSGMKRQLKHSFCSSTEYYTSGGQHSDVEKDESLCELLEQERIDEIDERLSQHLSNFRSLSGGIGALLRKDIETVAEENQPRVIESTRQRMKRRVAQGEITYRETPLGACLTSEPCESRARGEISACTRCRHAIIETDKVTALYKLFESHENPFIRAQAEHFSRFLLGIGNNSETNPS